MILIKDKEGRLNLVSNQSIEFYTDAKILEVLNDLPIELRRLKVGDSFIDIKNKQLDLLDKAQTEVILRTRLLERLNRLEKKYI